MPLRGLFDFVMRWFLIGIIVLFCLPVLYMGTSFVYSLLHTYRHAYRLTIEVETPHGLVTGSSVIQVTVVPHMIHWNPSAGASTWTVKGEAIFLDLGDGKNLVATLGFGPTGSNVDRISGLAPMALGHEVPLFYEKAPSWTGQAELKGDLIPTLVTFSDPSDPYTAQVVPPDDIESIFGPGYHLKRAWIEMTKDSVTRGIKKELPWLVDFKKIDKKKLINIYWHRLYFNEGLFVRRM